MSSVYVVAFMPGQREGPGDIEVVGEIVLAGVTKVVDFDVDN